MLIHVLEYLEATAGRLPDKTALIDGQGSLTFAGLQQQARLLAGRITARTAARNQPVGVYLPKSNDCIVAFAAILYSGNCYAPLDMKSPPARLSAVLEKLGPALLITCAAYLAELRKCGVPEERILCLDNGEPAIPVAGVPVGADTDPVYIIHTSGSTGVPKGVVISHRGVIDYIEWARACYQAGEDDVIGNQAPFHFDNSTLDIYLCFAAGATLVFIPEELFAFPARLIEYLAGQGINLVFWVPSVFASVANLDILGKTALPPLRKILFAGEVMQNKHLNYWRRHFPRALFSNLYGPTEITVDCTYYTVDREFADDEPLPIGVPCRNSDVLILNEQDRPAAEGELGELCVRGSSLALGYWDDPEKTAAAFVQNPLNPHYPERIYRTGDLVYRSARGEIMFAGRKDFQIKHMGYRIELPEIEYQAQAIDGIGNACVLYNRSRKEITLFYEARVAELTPATIRRKLSEIFPKYMLPTAFHKMEELPRNSNGKIDRNGLAAQLEQTS